MRPVLPLAALLLGTTMLFAQEASEAPRVDGQTAAQGAEVVLSEVNTDAYPQVTLFATVLQDGQPLTGLEAQDFRVREDEVDQQPLTVEEQLPPLSVVVTLDTSGSMSDALDDAQAAATAFVEGLGEQDSVQLVRFAREVETATSMTSTRAAVTDAIAGLTARGDTALFDALMLSVDLAGERQGRKAIVVLSDGVDDDGTGQPLSEAALPDVLARAAAVNVPIFVVGLGDELDEASLVQIAEETGGLYLKAPGPEELSTVYDQIGAQRSGQYAIGYTSSLPQDGTTRRVDLDALGVQASKEHVPGAAAPATPAEEVAAAPLGCAPFSVLETVRPDLEQAKRRFDAGLIDSVNRTSVENEAMEAIRPAMEGFTSLDCHLQALGALHEAEEAGLVAPWMRASLGNIAVEQIKGGTLVIGNVDEALARVSAAYEAGDIESAERMLLTTAILETE